MGEEILPSYSGGQYKSEYHPRSPCYILTGIPEIGRSALANARCNGLEQTSASGIGKDKENACVMAEDGSE